MIDKIEYEREIRIKKNAELSMQRSKLPPRMAEYEKQRKEMMSEGGENFRSKSVDKLCTF